MIQRIQTIFLFLATLSCVAFIFVPFGQVKTPNGNIALAIFQVVPVLISTIVVAAFSFIAIFLFNNRKLQSKIVLLTILLSLILIGLFIFGVTQHIGIQNYIFGFSTIFPLLVLLFNMLAYRGIKKDDALVRSMDRLR